jgi:ATP-dependent helicase/nuclease subunit A
MLTELTPQQSKALNFEHSISLRANAGSGKTFVFAKRYLQIALEANIPLQKIAAITFTDKAAGELYNRIVGEITLMMSTSTENSFLLKLEKIRRQLVSANISTIHSFCIYILREFPVDAELDANFKPIDQNISSELLELSIEETLIEKLRDETNQEIRQLIRLFGSKNNLVKQLRALIDNRKIVNRLKDEIYKMDTDKTAYFFREKFIEYFGIIYIPQIESLIRDLTIINNLVNEKYPDNKLANATEKLLTNIKDSNQPEVMIYYIHQIIETICTTNRKVKKTGYLSGTSRKSFEKEVNNIEKILSDFSKIEIDENTTNLEIQLALTGKYLINLFDDTLYSYDRKKKDLGYLDYEDILIKTKILLETDNVVKYLSNKFNYLMVDEYQDTNEIQYEIFMPILDYLKKGNLFVVGDEKQSIYRFREAELEIFDKTISDIAEKSGNEYSITLPDSFRMDPKICLFTNVLFRNLFLNPNKLFNEVEHSDLICAKPVGSGGEVSIIIAEKDSELSEAEIISGQIISLVNDNDSKLDWKDVAVIVRKRSSFKDLEKYFTNFRIPYRIIGGRGFYQRQSVYDIYNYFSFLLDTNNDAALIGILRSPFFTMSDLKIFEISLYYGNSFWEKMLVSKSEDEQLTGIINQLKENIEISESRDFNTLLRKIFEDTDFIAVLASKPGGEQELANIEKLQRITNAFTNHGFKTLYDYVNFLKDSILKLEDEAQAGLSSQSNAVSLLTLHQAKGLEFPVVFLFKCDETSQDNLVKSKSLCADKKFGILTKIKAKGDYFSEYKLVPIVALRDYLEKRKNLGELKRLFYVAVTRAKEHLFLSATSQGRSNFNPSSFMGMLFNELNINNESDDLIIEDELTFLKREDGNYKNVKMQEKIRIPIIRNINFSDINKIEIGKEVKPKKFLLGRISDKTKGEIISATKVNVFSQCPFKYNLIYNYGYSDLYSGFRTFGDKDYTEDYGGNLNIENSRRDDDNEIPVLKKAADIKGQIIHKALQREIGIEDLEKFVKEELDSSYSNLIELQENRDLFIINALEMLKSFYNSGEFKYLQRYSGYKNEMEIYLNEENHFLYGIIDKFIITDDKHIIVDYKTDDIERNSIEERGKNYLNQLNFYVYIVSKLYKEFYNIEFRIVFLKYPDNPFIVTYDRENVDRIGKDISHIINNISIKDISKDISHCSNCNFSINNNCIV